MQTDVVDRLTGQARRALQAAQRAALDNQDDYVGTEHLLLSLLADAETGANHLLGACGVDVAAMRRRLAQLLKRAEQLVELNHLPATPALKRVLEAAAAQADELRHGSVGTEHLLLGLAAEPNGAAGELLAQFGVTLGSLREALARMPVGEDRDLSVQAMERPGVAPLRADPGVAEVRRLLDAGAAPIGVPTLPTAGNITLPEAVPDATDDLAVLRAFGCLPQLAIGLLLGTLTGALWGTWAMLLCIAIGFIVGASRSGWLGMLWGAFAGYHLAQRLCADETEALLVILVAIVAGSCIGDWPRRLMPRRANAASDTDTQA